MINKSRTEFMHTTRNFKVIFLFLMTGIFSFSLFSQESDFGIIPKKSYLWFDGSSKVSLKEKAEPVVQIPPICGKKRRKQGYDLSLPIGTGANFFYFNQYYTADDLKLVSDSVPEIYATGVASVQNSTSGEIRVTFRPDVWILPFLNVYGMVGYSQSTTRPNFEVPTVTIVFPEPIGELEIDTADVIIDDELIYYGPTYGGGVTVSSGYGSFFFVFDYHYMFTKPKDLTDKVESHSFSGKAGVLLGKNRDNVKGSFWLGAMFVNDNHRFSGQVDVKDILPGFEVIVGHKATYSGTVHAKQPWNFIAGGSVIINKHHILALEAGYFKREQLSVTYGFRF